MVTVLACYSKYGGYFGDCSKGETLCLMMETSPIPETLYVEK
jgi:hypothetical protein